MANYTSALGLYKIDPITDGNSTFNMETILNNNWDKIDTKYDEQDNTVKQNSDKINQNTNITTVLGNDIGDKSKLKTTDRSNVVNAVNEVSTQMADIANSVARLENITSDKQYVGEVSIETVAGDGSLYDLLYLSSTGYRKALANSDTTIPCVGIRLEVGTGSKKILKSGYVRNDTWTFTKGQLLYVSSSTEGLITNIKPTATTHRIQIIGYAVTNNTVYFNPDYTWIEI